MPPMPYPSDISYQSWYDEKRIALGRSIDRAVEQLREMQAANSTWPLYYPSSKPLTQPIVELDDNDHGVNSLPTAPELLVLRLDVRFGATHHNEFVQRLGKDTIASVLEEKITICSRQLLALRERINDPLSKILVTGDVNAGKSTFCNALLRRRILPQDQQPCTAIFCEVLNAKKNSGLEEVHAATPQHDFDVFAFQDLEQVVTDARYTQCKVFVNDLRTADESLLSNNEVVDITLIDAPGLNHDTTHTTAVFARQEEIDVVVFVVSATNHFTISAKDFIQAATAEKEYLFIVVNAFDTITNKERCKKGIMEQIRQLSPATFKESSELVHFVSSNAVLRPSLTAQGNTNSKCENENMDEDKVRDFQRLERSLRKFVLENRAKSKLAPARTYLLNTLHDINTLATATVQEAQSELSRASKAMNDITPQLETQQKIVVEAGREIDTMIENTCLAIFDHNRSTIGDAIAHAGDEGGSYDVVYRGPWTAFEYAEELKEAMLSRIVDVVIRCEDNARAHAAKGVSAITQLGILHGRGTNAFENLQFRPAAMFSRKRDSLARQVDISIELQDFIDWPRLVSSGKFANAGMALTLATAIGSRLTDLHGWLNPALMLARSVGTDGFRRLLVSGILVTVIAAAIGHIMQQIPHAVPRHLAAKVAAQLSAIDYVYANSARITDRVRRVLRIPAEDVRAALNSSVRDLEQRRDDMDKLRDKSHAALKCFGNIVWASAAEENTVKEINLEAPPSFPE
ncbi:GTPase FZO1 [Metarhizium acridum CQMa 102]|uniref:GTPase FZO1 n=1 Tax=Metarhizium acridum (strain CQMa 102) TaxID=655827 RepID=E9EDT6_METAQ|nr:GTPase FZO1 [Metarhizium acridum CQMa 102]EFY85951.1 GTPase FZO1 [Metarhizium acridum CQMa 102]